MMSIRSLKTLPGWRISRTCVLHRNNHERSVHNARTRTRTQLHTHAHVHARTNARARDGQKVWYRYSGRVGAQWVAIDERHDDSMARHVDGLRHGEAVLVQRLPATKPQPTPHPTWAPSDALPGACSAACANKRPRKLHRRAIHALGRVRCILGRLSSVLLWDGSAMPS
jgi:hypothetical protein